MTVALVIGGASCVVADLEAALDLGEFDGIVGCNLIGVVWPGAFDAWVSLHTEHLRPWSAGRARRGLPPHKRLMGIGDTPHRFPGQDKPGSSGLFALKVALDDLGFERAVLCGIPISPAAAHFNDTRIWRAAHEYEAGWRQALPHIADRTRSMSGWTQGLLGSPTPEWIAGD